MSKKTALDLYKDLSATTGQMLAAAQAQDWDLLVALEKDVAIYTATLKETEVLKPVGSSMVNVKVAYIKKILDDDRQIRSIVSPWMEKLEGMINIRQSDRDANMRMMQQVNGKYSQP